MTTKKFYVNFQPVIPFSFNADWNAVHHHADRQQSIFLDSGHQFGLGHTLQSSFFTPTAAGPIGIIWGVVCGHFENDSISALRTTRFRFENDSISHPSDTADEFRLVFFTRF